MFDLCGPMKGCATTQGRHLFMEGDLKFKDNINKVSERNRKVCRRPFNHLLIFLLVLLLLFLFRSFIVAFVLCNFHDGTN